MAFYYYDVYPVVIIRVSLLFYDKSSTRYNMCVLTVTRPSRDLNEGMQKLLMVSLVARLYTDSVQRLAAILLADRWI